jgi:sugar O-acyltransferase (sialic acid O-acetyltransferase NeuD family)
MDMPTAKRAVAPDLPVLFYGGTGQAIVNREILELQGGTLAAVADDTPGLRSPFPDVPLLEGWDGFRRWRDGFAGPFGFSVCIGNPHGRVRLELARRLCEEGGIPLQLVHPSAVVARDCVLGEGCQIMAGAVIQPHVRIGAHGIVNTRAAIDHECVLEDAAEIGPGAVLCGRILVGAAAWVGAGATVMPRLRIGSDSIVGAGSLVRSDVRDGSVVVGVPARELRGKETT